MKPVTILTVLILILLNACGTQAPSSPSAPPTEPVSLQVFGRSHQDNPWAWTGLAVIATPDSMYTQFKPENDSLPFAFGKLPRGTRIVLSSTLFSALPDSAWWISGIDTTRLYLAMGSADLSRAFTVGAP